MGDDGRAVAQSNSFQTSQSSQTVPGSGSQLAVRDRERPDTPAARPGERAGRGRVPGARARKVWVARYLSVMQEIGVF
jgi:hypothetical protein